ncbi:DUF3833 family protein [Sphingomonas sp.]|uniref:DUF3833 family protein n=1 Tax=Sphingomonas sp. TaxID=28214 RepID=UPI0025DEE4DD|nr:DUF3833 family protein [Sphingomonas sp.]MBV9526741.1 DUF3833 family protein [Sphingomonas sp.]
MRLAPAALGALVLAATPAAAAFNPVEFFRGRTHGEGTLKIIFQSTKTMSVDSEGSTEKDGTLLLKQVIHEPSKPPRVRYWRMRQTGSHSFAGTLTDAAGPVRVDVNGDEVRIRYTATNNLDFDQLLTPQGPDRVHNVMKIKRFGFTVAHYDEFIRKLD